MIVIKEKSLLQDIEPKSENILGEDWSSSPVYLTVLLADNPAHSQLLT